MAWKAASHPSLLLLLSRREGRGSGESSCPFKTELLLQHSAEIGWHLK